MAVKQCCKIKDTCNLIVGGLGALILRAASSVSLHTSLVDSAFFKLRHPIHVSAEY
jgi:hypothetical protein